MINVTFSFIISVFVSIYPAHSISLQNGESGGEVLFERNDELYIIDIQSKQERYLTYADRGGQHWSPDGSTIVFSRRFEDATYIFTISSDGSNETKLAKGNSPSWSPDGSRIAYRSDGNIYIVDVDGNNKKLLATEAQHYSIWSPDGNRIYFDRGFNDRYELWSVDMVGKETSFSPSDIWLLYHVNPTPFSPDGSKVLYTTCGDGFFCIEVMDIDGTNPIRIGLGGLRASWSPNGTKIVYTTDEPGIFVVDIDGSNRINLVDESRTRSWPSGLILHPPSSFNEVLDNTVWPNDPSWSPNGEKIVFSSRSSGNVIYLIKPDGTGFEKLTDGTQPQWSPKANSLISLIKSRSWGEVKRTSRAKE